MRTTPLLVVAAACLALAGCNTSSSGSNQATLDLCGLACPDDGGGSSSGGSSSGGSSSGGSSSGGSSSGGGGGTGGNTKLNGGDTTIALEAGALVSPSTGSYSKLTVTQDPNTATFQIDTKQKDGAEWNEAVPMAEFPAGTQLPSLFTLANGFDPAFHPDNLNANNYTEYRNISATAGGTDEVLQVWNFSDSYATQYRSLGTGGEAADQAFSFGGTKTPAGEMPTTATATYSGAYGATVKAWNWASPDNVDPDVGNIDPNGLFMVNGLAEITADFGAAKINGTLTPTSWKFAGTDYWYYYDVIDNSIYTRNADNTANYVTQGQFVPAYFDTKTYLTGNIAGNTYSGKADLGESFVSGDNPMYGAFFGPGARETTGIFSVLGVTPQPTGGEYPINDDRRAYVQQSGVFNAKCQAGGACTP